MIVKGGLHSFLFEIARVSKTSGPHFTVQRSWDGYVIEHHGGRWRVTADVAFVTITVETDDGQQLRIDGDVMTVNGMQTEQVCAVGYRCFDAQEIKRRTALSILAWVALGYLDRGVVAKALTAVTGEPP